jgi:hypothetical protein
MVFTTAGGGASQLYPYEIDNSLRFNEQDDAKLSFDPDSAGNVDTMTISFWMKPDLNFGGDHNNIFSVRPSAGSYAMLVHRTGGEILFEHSGAGDILKTNRLFRDPSAWYHIVLALDSTNSTASLRARLYVNGIEETSFATDGRASHSQNTDFLFGGTNPHQISGDPTGNYFYGGYLADFYYVNGTQLAPTSFGETNDNGVWIPKAYGGSYGTNGFHLEFKETGTSQNSSGMGADTSGNDNHFAVTNLAATDVTTDTPTNNFATLNPLDNAVLTLSEGNTKATHSDSGGGEENRATLGAANGKWYFEFQIQHTVGSLNPFAVGMMSNTGRNPLESDLKSTEAFTSAWHTDSSVNRIESRVSGSSTLLNCNLSYPDNGDIVNVAMDLDNGRVFFGKNGTYINDASGDTGNPSTGANPPVSFTTGGHFYFPAIHNRGSQGLTVSLNTGQPSFSISSGNADANGYGNFEYAVPSGYYALCTKNLAEYG